MRWFFRRRTLEDSGLFRGFTDWHSHLLPGVDDGVKTMAESLLLLQEYERLGVREVWLTPHIMEDVPNTTVALRDRFAALQAAYDGSVQLHLAAEYMLDNLFAERFESGDLLPLGDDGNHLLVETSCFSPPTGFHDLLERIKTAGFRPVLAHPERYGYMDYGEYHRLKTMGICFQLNLFSLYGLYGKDVQRKACKLSAAGCYDYTGTDLHRADVLAAMLRKKR